MREQYPIDRIFGHGNYFTVSLWPREGEPRPRQYFFCDIHTGKNVAELPPELISDGTCQEISDDGKYIAFQPHGYEGNTFKLYQWESKKFSDTYSLAHDKRANQVRLDFKGSEWLRASAEYREYINKNGGYWQLEMFNAAWYHLPDMKRWNLPDDPNARFTLQSNGQWLVAGTREKTFVFDTAGKQLIHTIDVPGLGSSSSSRLSDDIYVTALDGDVFVSNLRTGKQLLKTPGRLYGLMNYDDGKYFMVENWKPRWLEFWRLEPKPEKMWSKPLLHPIIGHWVRGSRIFTSSDSDPICAYDLQTGALIWSRPGKGQASPDGRFVWCWDESQQRMLILDGATGRELFDRSGFERRRFCRRGNLNSHPTRTIRWRF